MKVVEGLGKGINVEVHRHLITHPSTPRGENEGEEE